MRTAALWFLAAALPLGAQGGSEAFGLAVKHSLDRTRIVFPDLVRPESPLSQAVLERLAWLNTHDFQFFSDPEWPMKVAAYEAAALGIRPKLPEPAAPQRTAAHRRHLAVVLRNFGTSDASFRKGQHVIINSIQDHGKRGTVVVAGEPLLLWLDNFQILREIPPGESAPPLLKIESARYGFPGQRGYSVSPAVQALATSTSSGELLVSDALLPPATAQKLQRESASSPAPSTPAPKILTVVYTVDGLRKTRQGVEGQVLVLD